MSARMASTSPTIGATNGRDPGCDRHRPCQREAGEGRRGRRGRERQRASEHWILRHCPTSAPSSSSRPRAISASVMTYGGSSRTTVSDVRLTTRPRCERGRDDRRRVAAEIDAPDEPLAANVRVEARGARPSRGARARRGRPWRRRDRTARLRARRAHGAPRGTPAGCRRRSFRDRQTQSWWRRRPTRALRQPGTRRRWPCRPRSDRA